MAEKIKQGEKTGFKIKKIDPKGVEKRLKELHSRPPHALLEEGYKAPTPRLFKGACRIPGCGGDITERIVQEYNPMTGPPIFGPGSRQQYHYVSQGLYCKKCGVKYEFVPGEEQGEEE